MSRNYTTGNCSELRGNEQVAAVEEWVKVVALQVPKRDARAILVLVPRSERVPPLIYGWPPGAVSSVQPHCSRVDTRVGNEDEQFLDEPFYAPAELGLRRSIVVGEGLAQRQQKVLQHQLVGRR